MSTAIAGPPVQDLVEGGTWALRHVYPVLPWFSAAVLTTPGVIRYYRLDETAGVNAADAVAGQTGTYTGGPTLAAAGLWTPDDATNRAVSFTAAGSQYVSVPTIDFATAVKSHTIETIVNLSSLAVRQPIFTATGAAVAGQVIFFGVLATGALTLEYFGSALNSATGLIATGTTYHLAATYDAATDATVIYINGANVGSGTQGPYTGSATPTCRIASYSLPPEFMSGTVDELAIYARALSAAEVVAHAEAAGLAPTSTVNGGAVKRSSTLILGKPYGATVVPVSTTIGSPDFAQGSYTHRLDDAGELDLTFPNGVSSDGFLWRERFSPSMHREWLEVYRGPIADASRLEFVANIESANVDRGAVQVKGHDAFALLKKAYESDREWTAAPRDVVEAYTRAPRVLAAEDFTSATSLWTPTVGTTLSINAAQGIAVATVATFAGVYLDLPALGDNWDISVVAQDPSGIRVSVSAHGVAGGTGAGAAGNHAHLSYLYNSAGLFRTSDGTTIVSVDQTKYELSPGLATVTLSRRGRWVYGWHNQTFMGVLPWIATGTSGRVWVESGSSNLTIDRIMVRNAEPFLLRGATVGDRYLPGVYPTGGLHARYWNNADLQGFSAAIRRNKVFAPDRPISNERLDATPGGGVAALPNNLPADYMSMRWQGAVYLRGDLGDYQLQCTGVIGGVRVYVANTDFGDQVLDDWTVAGTRTVGPATVPSSTFGSKATWVPIVVEFHDDAQAQAFNLQFSPPGAGTYTDPGGATITRGAFATIPATSLSPLGCFDNRVQGASHYDLVKQAVDAFGLHLWLEPMQLESGEFPGRLTARERWGRDTDVQLRSEDLDIADPFLSPSIETDSSDVATTLRGSGAGLADGRGSQVTAEITDAAAAMFALFDLQAVSDAGDIAFRDLLAARLDAELGLRNTEWTNITGQPRGRERLADTWPLTSTYSAMRWRPGDAVRLSIPDIGVDDATPRQVLQVTREIVPEGLASCQVAFRQRPRGPAAAIRKATRQALLPRRVYQRQKILLQSEYLVPGAATAAAAFTSFFVLQLLPGDLVVRAVLRVTVNSTNQPIGVEINSVDRTTALGGSWSNIPLEVDITAYASQTSSADARLLARLKNNGAVATTLNGQFVVEVLR